MRALMLKARWAAAREPAKWAAIGALTTASIGGLALSLWERRSGEVRVMPREELFVSPPVPLSSLAAAPAASGSSPETPAAPASPITQAPAPAAPVATADAAPTAKMPQPPVAGRINVNTASKAQLELLPGIGPALAQRIIDFRQQNGAIRSLSDLDRVKGIGPKLIERLAPLVAFEAPDRAPATP